MGNRCVIGFEGSKQGLYLHWNGGADSVYAFLDYADKYVGQTRGWDDSYAHARLCQIVGNFFGGVTSLGFAEIDPANIGATDDSYGLDNGVFIVGPATVPGRGYRIAARFNGKFLTGEQIKAEEKQARKSAYWKDGQIMNGIAKANDPFFKDRP